MQTQEIAIQATIRNKLEKSEDSFSSSEEKNEESKNQTFTRFAKDSFSENQFNGKVKNLKNGNEKGCIFSPFLRARKEKKSAQNAKITQEKKKIYINFVIKKKKKHSNSLV